MGTNVLVFGIYGREIEISSEPNAHQVITIVRYNKTMSVARPFSLSRSLDPSASSLVVSITDKYHRPHPHYDLVTAPVPHIAVNAQRAAPLKIGKVRLSSRYAMSRLSARPVVRPAYRANATRPQSPTALLAKMPSPFLGRLAFAPLLLPSVTHTTLPTIP